MPTSDVWVGRLSLAYTFSQVDISVPLGLGRGISML